MEQNARNAATAGEAGSRHVGPGGGTVRLGALLLLAASSAGCTGVTTLTEFSRDVVPLLQLVVTTLGLISIVFFAWEMHRSHRWQTIGAYQRAADNLETSDTETKVFEVLEGHGVRRTQRVPDHVAEALLQDNASYHLVKTYLNRFEDLCGMIRIQVVDDDLAYSLNGTRVIHAYRNFEPFIHRVRRERGQDPELGQIWREFQFVAAEWGRRRENELEEEKRRAGKTKGFFALSNPLGRRRDS